LLSAIHKEKSPAQHAFTCQISSETMGFHFTEESGNMTQLCKTLIFHFKMLSSDESPEHFF